MRREGTGIGILIGMEVGINLEITGNWKGNTWLEREGMEVSWLILLIPKTA